MGTNIGFSNFIGSSNRLGGTIKGILPTVRYSAKGKYNTDSDRATLKDLTGNGLDSTLRGFNFTGVSGYNGYTSNLSLSIFDALSGNLIENPVTELSLLYSGNTAVGYGGFNYDAMKYGDLRDCVVDIQFNGTYFNITNNYWWYLDGIINDNYTLMLGCSRGVNTINTDYLVPPDGVGIDGGLSYIAFETDSTEFTITMVTMYPNGLLFDGVDDSTVCNKAAQLKTIIMKCLLNSNGTIVFDERMPTAIGSWFALYTDSKSIAYNTLNLNGSTYINGKLNTIIMGEGITGTPVVVAMTNSNVLETFPFVIGTGTYLQDYSKMVLYDFIGYNKVLTEKEILSEIKKYKLEDGGGEITPKPIARYSCKGLSNSDTDRDILKDLSNNGHDIQLKNFSWSGMSGYGGFNVNWTIKMSKYEYEGTISQYQNKLVFSYPLGTKEMAVQSGEGIMFLSDVSTKIKISNLNNGIIKIDNGKDVAAKSYQFERDGIYDVLFPLHKTITLTVISSNNVSIEDITIEQVPFYPDGLVFDGVDDYGICKNLNLGQDYTVICKRHWIEATTPGISRVLLSKRIYDNGVRWGEFVIEKISASGTGVSTSYNGLQLIINFNPNVDIIVQTKTSYQDQIIKPGVEAPTSTLNLGSGIPPLELFKGVIYDVLLYDKTLTKKEIESEILKYNL